MQASFRYRAAILGIILSIFFIPNSIYGQLSVNSLTLNSLLHFGSGFGIGILTALDREDNILGLIVTFPGGRGTVTDVSVQGGTTVIQLSNQRGRVVKTLRVVGDTVSDESGDFFASPNDSFLVYETLPGQNKQVNLANDTDDIIVVKFNIANLGQDVDDYFAAANDLDPTDPLAEVAPAVLGRALFYPNPARQTENPQLGYKLSKDLEIEIHIYDMLTNLIFKNTFKAGGEGGRSGYNKLTLNLNTFRGFFLSAGVYFYYVIHEGAVLDKGKLAIIP